MSILKVIILRLIDQQPQILIRTYNYGNTKLRRATPTISSEYSIMAPISSFIFSILSSSSILYYIVMGVKTSSTTQPLINQQLTASNKLENDYYQQLFNRSIKTERRFRHEIVSICKRSSYLRYEWAEELREYLGHSDGQKLYSSYKRVLKENCLREGKKEKAFCQGSLTHKFQEKFLRSNSHNTEVLSISQLLEKIDEVKCYQMVRAWLHQIASPQPVNDQQNLKSSYKSEESLTLEKGEEIVYEILVKQAQRTYKAHLAQEQPESVRNLAIKTTQVGEIVRQIRKEKTVLLKARWVEKIAKTMNNQEGTIVEDIVGCLGRSEVFGVLLICRELGLIDVQKLWQRVFGHLNHQLSVLSHPHCQ